MGQLVHTCIIESELETDHSVLNALFNMYSKCGAMLDARWVFEKVHPKGVLTYNILIAAYAQEECNDSAIEVVQRSFDSVLTIDTALIGMYGKYGALEEAHCVFGWGRGNKFSLVDNHYHRIYSAKIW